MNSGEQSPQIQKVFVQKTAESIFNNEPKHHESDIDGFALANDSSEQDLIPKQTYKP